MSVFRVWAAECWVWIWFHLEAGHQVDPPGGHLDLQRKLGLLENIQFIKLLFLLFIKLLNYVKYCFQNS